MCQVGRFASLGRMVSVAPRLRPFALALGVLALASACTAVRDEPAVVSPNAQATATRRAEVAEVQRILAGNPAGTLTPEPTATVPPMCASALWWHEARDHVGESRVIQGPVVRTRPGPGDS